MRISSLPNKVVYEKWEEDAITEVNSLYSFEIESTELTAYAQDLLSLIGDFLDWADYEQESRMEFLNAIDLFGIKRALLISKLKKLQKKYPDVEKYRREDLLEFLGEDKQNYNDARMQFEYSNVAAGMRIPGINNMELNNPTNKIDIKPTLDIREIINPVITQTNVCNNPINKPTRKYPNIK